VTYDQLYKFIAEDMQMSHVYQPVMLIEMLVSKTGTATVEQIAKAILDHDPTQIDYYSEVVKKMPGVVLTKNRGIAKKHGQSYTLKDFHELTVDERQKLVFLCEERIRQYEEMRAGAHWDHRRKTREPVSGTVRYEVLSRAKFRCELCGIMDSEKALEVDHIVPKNLGGADDISNYQALCYTCNAQKRDRDSTDFRGLNASYDHREKDCLFCNLQTDDRERIMEENTLAYAVRDGFPVTKHHTLIIPKRHQLDFFALTQAELNAINALLHSQKKVIEKADSSVEGFNVGMNCGEIAGQSVWHCHVHLIPRRKGDVQHPKGGVRNIIAGKGDYSGNPLKIEEL
jgi:ATP adenylyltransferase